jgi:hypothetical protein
MPHSAGVAAGTDPHFREAIIPQFGASANRLIERAEMGENTVSKAILL